MICSPCSLAVFRNICHPLGLTLISSTASGFVIQSLKKPTKMTCCPANKNKKPSSKPGKGKKLPNRHSDITRKVAEDALAEKDFPFYYEITLQKLFAIASVVPSMELGLIDSDNLTVSFKYLFIKPVIGRFLCHALFYDFVTVLGTKYKT